MTDVQLDQDAGPVAERRGRKSASRPFDQELAERLVAEAREAGINVVGEGGLLQQMTKTVPERALAEELSDHLGYEPYDPAGAGSGNNRNGITAKTVATELGPVELEVPRDRNGSFSPADGPQGAAPARRHRPARDRPLRPRHDRPRYSGPAGRDV